MKKHQTAKHKRRKKKELANRKAKQLIVQKPSAVGTSVDATKRLIEAKPISPARRAFQDV